MLAAVLAEIVATVALPDSLMTEKLSRRGLRVEGDYEVDVLASTLVRDVMSRTVETVSPSASIGEVRHLIETGGHGAYPLVDDAGAVVGIVARQDLIQAGVSDADPVSKIATKEVVTATSAESLLSALRRLLEEDVDHLPVVDEGILLGMCTRTDILRARGVQLRNELIQPGWVMTSADGFRRWYPLIRRTRGDAQHPRPGSGT